jgi:hypothetical protein
VPLLRLLLAQSKETANDSISVETHDARPEQSALFLGESNRGLGGCSGGTGCRGGVGGRRVGQAGVEHARPQYFNLAIVQGRHGVSLRANIVWHDVGVRIGRDINVSKNQLAARVGNIVRDGQVVTVGLVQITRHASHVNPIRRLGSRGAR